MKAVFLALFVALAAPATLLAQSGDMKGMDMKSMDDMKMDSRSMSKGDKSSGTHKATGVVKSMDPKKGSVTVAHDPVPSLKWPSMTMAFRVQDKAMLDKLTTGKRIKFEFVSRGKDYVMTSVK